MESCSSDLIVNMLLRVTWTSYQFLKVKITLSAEDESPGAFPKGDTVKCNGAGVGSISSSGVNLELVSISL